MLGRALIPDAPFNNTDGAELIFDIDYSGATRSLLNPGVGPFAGFNTNKIRVW
jgi:hypothetical protein